MTLLLWLVACRPDAADLTAPTAPPLPDSPASPPGETSTNTPPGQTPGATTPLTGFVGSPCETDLDCPYDGGVCLQEADGFPGGTCSAACDQYCDDAAGFPTTFCAETGALPPEVGWLGDGGCLSRCDFAAYPFVGCREDYGCVEVPRANDPGAATFVCLPDVQSALTPCLEDLAGRGVPFTPTILADSSPADAPWLTCHVEDPIVMQSGYLGVDIAYYDGQPGTITGACELGHAVADTIEDVLDDGVTTLRHLGTYVCRTISGTETLSRHGYGDAIDVYGFDFADGTRWTLIDDWEHDTTSFDTEAGEWLYDTSYGWHDQRLWNIVLTPNYNAAHDNHFHVDLTPGSDFLGFTDGRFFGPNPWPGE